MAGRPKQGIDYAGWSVNIFDGDTKIDKLLDAQGWVGFSIYFYLCQMAYKFDGYFYRWCFDDSSTTARRMGGGLRAKTVEETVRYCLRIGLFDQGLFDEWNILTSKGIQRRYLAAIQGRRVKSIIDDYWLLEKNSEMGGLEKCASNDDLQAANSHLQGADGHLQGANGTKVKESKVNTTHTLLKEVWGVSGFHVSNDAQDARTEICEWLAENGFSCKKQYAVQNRGDGRNGKIDILAEKEGATIGIEIDRDSPRDKSIIKLMQIDGEKVVLVRNGKGRESYLRSDGIAVIFLDCQNGSESGISIPKYRPEWFERFWALYPRHTAKAAAVKAWDKLKPDLELCRVMANAIRAQMRSPQWTEGPEHIPHPATWLNGARWQDEMPDKVSSGNLPEPEVRNGVR